MSDTFERFQALAVQVLAVDADKVTKEASFADDLDADSLDLAELVMALEDEFDITVEEDELEDIKTVGQAFDMVTAKLGSCVGPWRGRRVAVTGVGVLSSCGNGRRRLLGGAQRAAARGRATRRRTSIPSRCSTTRRRRGAPTASRSWRWPPPPRRWPRPARSRATRCAAAC